MKVNRISGLCQETVSVPIPIIIFLLIGGTRNSPVIHGVLLINADCEKDAEYIKVGIYDDAAEIGRKLRAGFEETGKVKQMSRNGDLFFDVEDEDDSIQNDIIREYESHYEDIGEILQNIADIEIPPSKVTAIVNRVLRENFGSIDKNTREDQQRRGYFPALFFSV